MTKMCQSGLARSVEWRGKEVEDLDSLVKAGKSVYVYGMPTSGLTEIICAVCKDLGKDLFRINFSMLRIGEDEHNESGIAAAILGECEGYCDAGARRSISGVIKVLKKITVDYRSVVIRIDNFDSFYKGEDIRIVCDLIEHVRRELADVVSFIVSGCHTPRSRLFSKAGVDILIDQLETYPIAPLREKCVRQFIERKYGERDLNESKILDIFEATAGDPKLIECLHNVRWCTDSHGLTENEKRKFQLSVQSFVDTVISVYGTERVPGGKSAVEDVWTGKTLNELTTLGCSELSTIGVLPDGKYKLPGVVVDYVVDAPSRLPSLSLLGEAGETVRCENVGIASETAQDDGGQSSKKCGAVEGCDDFAEEKKRRVSSGGESSLDVGQVASTKNGVLVLAVSETNEKKQVLVLKGRQGEQEKRYRFTSQKQWDFLDKLLKANNSVPDSKGKIKENLVYCDGNISKLFVSGNHPPGVSDFWNDIVKKNTAGRKIVSASIPRP